MAKHWFVASHGSVEHQKSNSVWNVVRRRATTFRIPAGYEIVFYCPDNTQLSMKGGWSLWDALMFGEGGGEQAAYDAAYKKAGPHAKTTDFYAYMDHGDFNQWDDGPNRGNAHPAMNTYGVWEVGDPSSPVIDLNAHPGGMLLSDIIGDSVFSGVTRLYWGCCKAHVKGQGNTASSMKIYTPSAWR
jgi:hypothetical protein